MNETETKPPCPADVVVEVTPLEWHTRGRQGVTHLAEDFTGRYEVYENVSGSWTLCDGMGYSAHDTAEDGMKAAYEEKTRRVVSAIKLRTVRDVVKECARIAQETCTNVGKGWSENPGADNSGAVAAGQCAMLTVEAINKGVK